MINQWKKKFNTNKIIKDLKINLKNKKFSEGQITKKFENKISNFLKVKYTVALPSGSVAILLALMALDLKKNDEVIISNRGWISVLNALKILNLKAIFVDVKKNNPTMCLESLKKKIGKNTKAIIPIHMGGRGCDIKKIKKMIKGKRISIIEDAAQAFGSKFKGNFLGTQSDIGCFSLSVAKTISSGQGGFVVTNNKKTYNKIRKLKNNGLTDIKNINTWSNLGFNFKFTDIAATIAITELQKFKTYKKKLIDLYKRYLKNIKNKHVEIIKIDINNGEIPQYIEVMTKKRDKLVNYLKKNGVDIRIFYPNLSKNILYKKNIKTKFEHSEKFEKHGLYLPSGPDQNKKDIKKIINLVNNFK